MKEQLKRVAAWCACAALITAVGTTSAFAAPGRARAYTTSGITQPWEGTVPFTVDPATDPTPDPTPDPGDSSVNPDPDTPSQDHPQSTAPPSSTAAPSSDSPPSSSSRTPTQTSSPRPTQNQSSSSSRVSRPNGGTVTSRTSSQLESSSETSSMGASSEESSSSTISLPDVDSMDLSIPQLIGSGVEEPTENNSLLGILAWVLIGVGILIVLIVLFTSAKSGSHKSVGRKRYHRGTYKSKKKHLLDDKYYRKNKYK